MHFNTDLLYYGVNPHTDAGWTLWLTEITHEIKMPLVMGYNFPVKPTKKQIRKLSREFRKS